MRMRTCLNGLSAALFALALIMLALPATAQVQRIRGTIASIDGNALTVNTREGSQAQITLADNWTVSALKKVDMSAIAPGVMMTNATITAVVNKSDGHSVNLKYKDGNVDILVPEGIPLVTPTGADRSDAKPGAALIIFATKQADGTLTAARFTVEKDGVKPPM